MIFSWKPILIYVVSAALAALSLPAYADAVHLGIRVPVADPKGKTLVPTNLFDGSLPSGKDFDLEIPLAGEYDAAASLEVWPALGRPCGVGPSGTRQHYRLAMTLAGSKDERKLHARVPALQVSTGFCFRVTIARDLKEEEETSAAATVGHRLIQEVDAKAACSPDSTESTREAYVAARIRAPLAAELERVVTSDGAKLVLSEETSHRAAHAIANQLVTSSACSDFHTAVRAKIDAVAAMDLANRALREAWTRRDAMLSGPTPGAQLPLVEIPEGAGFRFSSLKALADEKDEVIISAATRLERRLPDDAKYHDLVTKLRAITAAETKDRPAAIDAYRKSITDDLAVPFELYVAAGDDWMTPPEILALIRSDRLEDRARLDPAAVNLFVTQLKAQRTNAPQTSKKPLADKASYNLWITTFEGAVHADKDVRDAIKADSDAAATVESDRAALETKFVAIMKSPPVRAELRYVNVADSLGTADAAVTDSSATPVSPEIGLLAGVPAVTGEAPWLLPYAAVDVYFAKVDRVVGLDQLVGNTTAQRVSLSIGLLLTRPAINQQAITGLWTDQVPVVSIGGRITQFMRISAGGFAFHFKNANPAISVPRTAYSAFVAASIDFDLWATASGKVFK